MIGKKINQLATELAPDSTDLTIIGDPISGVSKKITLAQLGAIFSGAVSFYNDLASFPATGDINVIYCAKDTQKLYLWSGSAYTEVFPSQALLDTYQLRSEKGNANGYASLDGLGKVPISQLPSSLMEYKGTWNASTNTPTLANGTGDTGDVYICNVAGTVDFGAGPLTFAVGDYVIYSGSIWQRSSGAVGTVTSVAASITGDAIGITGSPVTTSGTLALAFSGTSSQYINGAGNLTTFPTLTGFVPYTGATANVDLGTFDLTADFITASRGSYTSSGGGNTLEISHTSGSGIALNITKGGNGEGLYINKTSGSGNAATIVGTLEATTLVKSGGTSTQFLKADGSVDSSTYLTTSAAATTYLPMVLSSTANSIEINGQFFDVASAANSYTSGRLIIAPTYGAIGYQNAGVFDGLKILTNGNAEFSNSGVTRFFNQVRFDSTLTNGTYTYTLPGATGTIALTSDLTGGTVTSVGLSSATSGVTIGSTPITTSGTITLAIATASGSQQGLLSSTDWTTFNNKQNALTNPVTGTGTTNYLPKFTGASTIGDSQIFDNGTNVGINIATPLSKLDVRDASAVMGNYQTIQAFSTDSAAINLGGGISLGGFYSGTSLIAQFGSIVGRKENSTSGNYDGYLAFGTNSQATGVRETMRLTSSGNLGLGVTPSAWGSSYSAFQVGNGTSLVNINVSSGYTFLYNNAYLNSSAQGIYINSGYATSYAQVSGEHRWSTAPSGTAGNAISFTQAMTLNASGNLSIGNTNDTYKLDVTGTGRFSGDLSVVTAGSTAVLFDGTNPSLTLRRNNNGNASAAINFKGSSAVKWQMGTNQAVGLGFEINEGDATANRFYLAPGGAATFSSSVTARQGTINGLGGSRYQMLTLSAGGTSDEGLFITTTGSGNDYYAIKVATGGSANAFALTNAGNVGIGTTSPVAALDVSGNATLVANFNYASSGTYVRWQNNGTSFGDVGSAGQLVSGGSTNDFAIHARSTYNMVFATNFTERMRITSGGNVLVGTTTNTSGFSRLVLNGGNGSESGIQANYAASTFGGFAITTLSAAGGGMAFYTYTGNVGSESYSERMRITSGGDLLLGKTSANQTTLGWQVRTSDYATANTLSDSTNSVTTSHVYSTGAGAYRFYVGLAGTVYATNTTISAISDRRFKENIQDIDLGINAIMALKPRKFDWKEGKGKNIKNDRGFIAQEFEQVFPDLIDIWKDPAPEGEEPYKSVRQDLIPVLVKAIQEQQAQINELKSQLNK